MAAEILRVPGFVCHFAPSSLKFQNDILGRRVLRHTTPLQARHHCRRFHQLQHHPLTPSVREGEIAALVAGWSLAGRWPVADWSLT